MCFLIELIQVARIQDEVIEVIGIIWFFQSTFMILSFRPTNEKWNFCHFIVFILQFLSKSTISSPRRGFGGGDKEWEQAETNWKAGEIRPAQT